MLYIAASLFAGESDVADSVSIVVGQTLTLRATVTQGVNVTFDWNFCHLSQRSSTPHINDNDNSCLGFVCEINEQVYYFSVYARTL